MLYCDSQSEIYLSNHFIFHSQSKQINVKCQCIQNAIDMKSFVSEKNHININVSDIIRLRRRKKAW